MNLQCWLYWSCNFIVYPSLFLPLHPWSGSYFRATHHKKLYYKRLSLELVTVCMVTLVDIRLTQSMIFLIIIILFFFLYIQCSSPLWQRNKASHINCQWLKQFYGHFLSCLKHGLLSGPLCHYMYALFSTLYFFRINEEQMINQDQNHKMKCLWRRRVNLQPASHWFIPPFYEGKTESTDGQMSLERMKYFNAFAYVSFRLFQWNSRHS